MRVKIYAVCSYLVASVGPHEGSLGTQQTQRLKMAQALASAEWQIQ